MPGQVPELLPFPPEQNAEKAPKNRQAHIRHYWSQKAICFTPFRYEFGKPVTPEVLHDRDRDEDGAGGRLVRVDRVS